MKFSNKPICERKLQWSHGILAMESVGRLLHRDRAHRASMEPWHFSHGEGAPPAARTACWVLQWSHGILAMESWNSELDKSSGSMLQWSHGILAMERCSKRLTAVIQQGASMEPWHFSHGEEASVIQFEQLEFRFNGAMAF